VALALKQWPEEVGELDLDELQMIAASNEKKELRTDARFAGICNAIHTFFEPDAFKQEEFFWSLAEESQDADQMLASLEMAGKRWDAMRRAEGQNLEQQEQEIE
jgi:hypothetical protein